MWAQQAHSKQMDSLLMSLWLNSDSRLSWVRIWDWVRVDQEQAKCQWATGKQDSGNSKQISEGRWDRSLVVLLGLRYSKGIAIWKQVLESQNKRNLAVDWVECCCRCINLIGSGKQWFGRGLQKFPLQFEIGGVCLEWRRRDAEQKATQDDPIKYCLCHLPQPQSRTATSEVVCSRGILRLRKIV